MPDTTQSEEFMKTTINDVDFVINQHFKSLDEKTERVNFGTLYKGIYHIFKTRVDKKKDGLFVDRHIVDIQTGHIIDLEHEIQAELELLTAEV
jgi:hypothetical protein